MDIPLNFCSVCGAPVRSRIPPGDSLPRAVCDACGAIHYRNPKLVVGALPEWEDRILLCRRAIEPRHGKWTLPAGFMENHETIAAAALRETREEANARIELGAMFTLLSVPHISQVHVIYRARLLDLDFAAGEETLEVALFREEEIPWDDIAFRTIAITLAHYFADRRAGGFGFHTGDVEPPPDLVAPTPRPPPRRG
jgi:ADP-ribose pyrophosphatase YjhB (NUDIX family)